MIKVIEQSTAERKEETRRLFESIKPLLDHGYGYKQALEKIGRIPVDSRVGYTTHGWFKELKEYGETQGYLYKLYSGKGFKK